MRRAANVVPLHGPREAWDGRGRCPTCHRRADAPRARAMLLGALRWALAAGLVAWVGLLALALWGVWRQPGEARPLHVGLSLVALWLLWRGAATAWALLEGWRPWRAHAFVEHVERKGAGDGD